MAAGITEHSSPPSLLARPRPPQRYGLGDVIQAFDGVDLIASPLLTALVRESPPGSRHHLTVIGSGAESSVTVELGIRS